MSLSSDDEEEITPQSVANYHFEDEDKSPISFAILPIQFDDAEKLEAANKEVYLRGTADGGLQKVYKEVVAWKLMLEDHQPRIMVLSKDKKWINLLKPRKSYYEDTIRRIMITVHLLHFLRGRPDSSEKTLWEHLRKVFSTFEIRPSVDDLVDHISLMKLFSERDQLLAKSQVLLGFINGKLRKRFSQDVLSDPGLKQSFIADDEDDEVVEDDDGDDSEDDSYLYDSVCAICDNGGDLLCCDGPCLRSFHAKMGTGADSYCKTLGFTKAEVEAMPTFLCKNCLYKQHQCFACGKLGSSDKAKGAEVYPCVSATCGHLYHPKCVAGLLFPDNQAKALEFQEKIAAGEPFTCPVHKCLVCKQGENKEIRDLQFAMCRRCPKSFHRKCLPREISFEDDEDEDIEQRAWEDLLPHRILIYCLDHEITDIGTPIRNHIIFPDTSEKKKATDLLKKKNTVLVKKKRPVSPDLATDRTTVKRGKVSEEFSSSEESQSIGRVRRVTQNVFEAQKKVKPLTDDSRSKLNKTEGTITDSKRFSQVKAKPSESATSSKPIGKILRTSVAAIDSKTENRIKALMKSSSIDLEKITRKFKVPLTHTSGGRQIDKSITQGKVEGSVEAIKTALRKLEDGGSVEDAKAVCEPEILKQVLKWSNRLKVYLAPFLHGSRYTSYGRHFTKVDKLEKIVDKLKWYAQNGDMIVDFSCGSNDFSQLMKEQLDSAGKKCYFKNYDIIQPKNDFYFEKRDWMTVNPKELPDGSQLIMGLNPPFGMKGTLANKFIDKALTFKPKLIILIVPRETERLDKKRPPYDLIWEDGLSLSGKSFYLPGSVDVNDKQMDQWNVKPPLLYLWSRSDWTSKHKDIALKYGHTSSGQKEEHPSERESQLEEQARILSSVETTEREPENKTTVERLEAEEKSGKSLGLGNKRRFPQDKKGRSRKRRKLKKAELSREKEVDNMSDMSISSSDQSKARTYSESYAISDPREVPSESRNYQDTYLGPVVEPEALTGTRHNSTLHDDEIRGITRRYATPPDAEGFHHNRHGWLSGEISSQDFRNSEGLFTNRDHNIDSFGWSPYLGGADEYARQSEAELLMHGRQNTHDSHINRFTLGSSASVFGQHGAGSSYAVSNYSSGTSTIQRYAPRLDGTNYMMPGNSSHLVPHPGRSAYDVLGKGNGPSSPMGFAPGPNPSYRRSGSSGGWVNR